MKLRQWLYGATALAMLAACSDHDVQPAGPADEGGDGYIGIKIQLPTENTTRANDDFNNGAGSEYDVNDAILVIFQGADQYSAKCTGAFTLKNSEPKEDTDKQVTSHVTRVANVSNISDEANNKIFALVMINGNGKGIYTQQQPQQEWMVGKTIQDFQEHIITEALVVQEKPGVGHAGSIFMTNSPLSTVQGGDNPPGTIGDALPVLVELDKTLYATEREALDNAAGVIHVERAVGKVTCSSFNKTTDLAVEIGDYHYTLEVDQIWWDMAQDLANSYIVRNTNRKPTTTAPATMGTDNLWAWNLKTSVKKKGNVDVDKPYRMLGHEALNVKKGDEVVATYYRPYFCQVPGYGIATGADKIMESKSFTKTTMEAKDAQKLVLLTNDNKGSAFYPRENTFPVEFMTYANTTRIGFWVTFKFTSTDGGPDINGSKNLYYSGADKSTLFVDEVSTNLNPLQKDVYAELANETKYSGLKAAIVKAVQTDKQGSFTMNSIQDLINVETTVNDDGGLDIKSISFKSLSEINGSDAYHEVFVSQPSYDFDDDMIDELRNIAQYYVYEGGKMFYELRIKHFGDDLTPWELETDINKKSYPATTTEESYGKTSQKNNYLGRYGIVRNNWYDVQISKITKLGYPKDPAIWQDSWPGKPDDNRDQYIAVELKVLSWAKRTQEHEF